MESPLQKALKKLREHQLVLKDSNVATGMIELVVVEEILQELEIDILNEQTLGYKKVKRNILWQAL